MKHRTSAQFIELINSIDISRTVQKTAINTGHVHNDFLQKWNVKHE